MRRTITAGALGGRSRLLVSALAAVGCVGALVGCGGSGSKPSAPAGPYGPASSPAALSRCMRANGVSGFPDPIDGPGGESLPVTANADGSLTAEGRTFTGPALQSAEHACKAYLPPSGPPPQPSAEQVRRALAIARCMRAHGVPSFPDPTFSGPSGSVPLPGSQSPAFRTASRVCLAGGAVVIGP